MNQSKLPKIVFVARDDGGCGQFRIRQPAEFIRRMGLAEVKVFQNIVPEAELLWANLVVMQEMGSTNAGHIVSILLKNKIPFISEFDDFIQHVSPNNIGGAGAWNPGNLFIHRAMEQARRSSALTVSTNQLAREYFPYNNLIYVVPNYLDKDLWDVPIARKNDGKIRIGWCGGNAHGDDLHMVSKVIERIVKEYDGKVVFETMGMARQELNGVFAMKDFPEVCPKCNYEGEIHHFLGESFKDYPLVLASKGWDLAIAPVIDNGFGNAKSDLKIKEATAVGLPIVASSVVPYREAVDNGAEVLLATTYNEWYNSIKELIENPGKREAIAKSNREWIKQYWIQDNAKNIFRVYEQIIAVNGVGNK